MRTRRTYYRHYGMTSECVKWLRAYCRTTPHPDIILEVAKMTNDCITEALYKSLRFGKSLTELQDIVDYIPYDKEDFYGYQRKAMFLLMERLLKENDEIKKMFNEKGWERKYLCEEEAADKFNIPMSLLKKIAKKSGASIKRAGLYMIDINKLQEYMEKNIK